jgi:hypothetical protein
MLTRSIIRRMSSEERNYLREGASVLGLLTGVVSYLNYREYIKKDFMKSEGHYRMSSRIVNMTPWK